MKIKRITQIHQSYERLGAFERVAIERWRMLNPDIEYHFIVDKDIDGYIAEQWPKHAATYSQMMPICRAGVQRLSAVLRWGGLYTDCGSYPVKPVEEFSPSGIWDRDLAMFKLQDRPNTDPLITDCIFAAEAGHPFLRGLVEEIFRRTESDEYKAKCVENYSFNYRRWTFETASVHVFSEYALKSGVTGVDGLADAEIGDLANTPEKVNILRYSTENWLKPEDTRWALAGISKAEDELRALAQIKSITGV